MNGHAVGNASGQYSTRNLELILNPSLRVPEYELLTGAKSRQQSRLDLDRTPDENQGFPPPQTQTDEGVREPPTEQGDQAVLLDSRANGALPLKHMRTYER